MSGRPKLYPRCFLGWWVSEDESLERLQQISPVRPRWKSNHREWYTPGEDGGLLATTCEVVPLHEFGYIPYEQRCIQITEEMCEPDPQVLVDALELIVKHLEIVAGGMAGYSTTKAIAERALAAVNRKAGA